LVAGSRGSGRSTTLATMAHSLIANNQRVAVVAPRSGPLAAIIGAALMIEGQEARKPDRLQVAVDDGLIDVVLVDDIELVDADHRTLRSILAAGSVAVVAAGLTEELRNAARGAVSSIKQHRCGLLLSPRSTLFGDLFGCTLDRSQIINGPPGRGYLMIDGFGTAIQVAT
jgi:DNA segregation ATPase FtsK/SpoIIIE, S-DNA-T family